MADDIDLDLITMQEAAKICRYKSIRPIQAAIKRRELTPYRLSKGRRILIARMTFIRWLIQQRGRPTKNGDKK